MQIKLARGGQLKHPRPLHPSCLYNTQVDMIGIRDSNPKQISPTGSSWLGRKPENNNGSSQAVMLHRKQTEQIEDNVSEGYFVLVSERVMSKSILPLYVSLYLFFFSYSFTICTGVCKDIIFLDKAEQV